MIANYHTHTSRCRHAFGSEEEYVLSAIEGGLEILGFSDHTPQFFPGDYYSRMRMYPEQLSDYVGTINQLKVHYAKKLDIHLGLEVEYYPALFAALLPRLQDAGVEYLLLGQHWNCNEFDAPYNGRPTEDVAQLAQYCNQVIDAMQTGLFTYLAHPDLIRFVGSNKVYETHIRRLCKEAKQCNVPLEINFLGLREGRNYPDLRFWSVAAEENCPVIFGCDAHEPAHTVQPLAEQQALAMVQQFDLDLQHTVPLRSI